MRPKSFEPYGCLANDGVLPQEQTRVALQPHVSIRDHLRRAKGVVIG